MNIFGSKRLRYFLQLCILVALCCGVAGKITLMSVAIPIFVSVILTNKIFCSYLCPLGFVSELAVKCKRVLKIKGYAIARNSLPDKLLRSIKYIILFLLVYIASPLAEASGIALLLFMVLIVVPSLFIDMFGCKYICPVGAASNILKFTLVFVGCSLLMWILRSADISIPIPVYVGVLCAIGYLLEIFTYKAEYNVSLLHIHRDKNKCTQCGECKKACPYSVNVSNVSRVVDIDCNLCGECVSECKEDALKVGICNTREGQNQIKGQWLPLLVVVIFILVMFYITSKAI